MPKAQVTSIGQRRVDVISQEEMRAASDLLAVAEEAARHAKGYMQAIAVRLTHGAVLEEGDYTFDARARTIRRRIG